MRGRRAARPLLVVESVAQVTVPRSGLTTLLVTPGRAAAGCAGAGPRAGGSGRGTASRAGRQPEPAQPVYARYWLHGKGPAPAGNMPVAVHLSPAIVSLDGGQPGALRLTVACGPAPAAGAGPARGARRTSP